MIALSPRLAKFLLIGIVVIGLAATVRLVDRSLQRSRADAESVNSLIQQLEKNWSSQPAELRLYSALNPHATFRGADDRPTYNPSDDYFGLPREGDYEFIAAYCGGCHSLEIVMQQRLDRQSWDRTLKWMVETQNMVPLDAEDHATFLDYLTEHFGAG